MGLLGRLPRSRRSSTPPFAGYPLPALFLEKKVTTGALGGGQTLKYEVVDGQQRLLAFHEVPLGPLSAPRQSGPASAPAKELALGTGPVGQEEGTATLEQSFEPNWTRR